MHKATVKIVIIFSLLSLTATLSYAKIGYKENVVVDSNHWGIERSTTNLTYVMKGVVKGNGKSIRQHSIENLAGVSVKECSHSLDGKLSITEEEFVVALEGPYEVVKEIENNSVDIKINESWPTFVKVNRLITYIGNGSSVMEMYSNNNDVIQTNFYAKKIVKLTIYTSNLTSMYLNARITPNKTVENAKFNKYVYYNLKTGFSDGIGKICYNVGDVRGEESYYGKYTVNKNIKYDEKFKINATKPAEWLNCTW